MGTQWFKSICLLSQPNPTPTLAQYIPMAPISAHNNIVICDGAGDFFCRLSPVVKL